MRRSKKLMTIISLVIITSVVVYTGWNSSTEPKIVNVNTSPYSYAVSIENALQAKPSLLQHNFSLAGNNANYSFILNGARNIWNQGEEFVFEVVLTKTYQSLSWPYGYFLLKIDSAIITVNNVSMTGSQVSNSPFTYNRTSQMYGFSYDDTIQLIVGENNVTSYSFTYSVEVTPVVEAGPYYVTGHSEWISKSFVGPSS